MNWLVTIYSAVLFFLLTPAILLRLPNKGNKYVVAGVHAIVFALLFHFTSSMVKGLGMRESMSNDDGQPKKQVKKNVVSTLGKERRDIIRI